MSTRVRTVVGCVAVTILVTGTPNIATARPPSVKPPPIAAPTQTSYAVMDARSR